MKISIQKSDTFTISNWPGGTTTEIYLHPKRTNYQKRNFDFRLSMAKVTNQESVFTPLPGIQRKLMVLDGNITLTHENHHSKQLGKFDIDVFDGIWKTHCFGTCIDFNLMMRGNTNGTLEGFSIQKTEVVERNIRTNLEFIFAFNFSGKIDIVIANELYRLNEKDLMIVERPETKTIQLTAFKNSDLVWGSITT